MGQQNVGLSQSIACQYCLMTTILPKTCYNGYGLVSECTDIPCLPADWDVGSEEACVTLDGMVEVSVLLFCL